MVYGHRVAVDIATNIPKLQLNTDIPDWDAQGTTDPREMVLITQSIRELKEIMSSYVGIVRNNVRLERALNRLSLLYKETDYLYHTTTISPQLCELRNLLTIAYLITRSAAMRKESRGLHYNTDFPQKNPHVEVSYL
jgi:L-aspartate oxidase